MSNNEYNESHITVLGDLEAIRNSAFMYLSTTPFYKLICELVQNSIDEGMAGRCSSVEVEYEEEGHKIRVKDNGYGIPLGSLLLVISKSNAGGKFHQSSEGSPYKRSFGKHGIGLKACNAVSDLFEIWSRRDGKEKYYKFSKGVQLDEYEKPYKGDTGTEVYLTPDESLLQDTNLNVETLLDTLELLSFLNPGFSIKFTMKSNGKVSISMPRYLPSYRPASEVLDLTDCLSNDYLMNVISDQNYYGNDDKFDDMLLYFNRVKAEEESSSLDKRFINSFMNSLEHSQEVLSFGNVKEK